MSIAHAVRDAANCLGSQVGAVLVVEDHIISTGYNGTPHGFPNCRDGGCVRCADRRLYDDGRGDEMTDPEHVPGRGLDRCICVHAEQNALLAAARFGLRTSGSTLYTTLSPCFSCLKESIQAGVTRIVYELDYPMPGSSVEGMYRQLADHLRKSGDRAFEQLG